MSDAESRLIEHIEEVEKQKERLIEHTHQAARERRELRAELDELEEMGFGIGGEADE